MVAHIHFTVGTEFKNQNSDTATLMLFHEAIPVVPKTVIRVNVVR